MCIHSLIVSKSRNRSPSYKPQAYNANLLPRIWQLFESAGIEKGEVKAGLYERDPNIHHDLGFLYEFIRRHAALFHHLDGHLVFVFPHTELDHSVLAAAQLFHQTQVFTSQLPHTWMQIVTHTDTN